MFGGGVFGDIFGARRGRRVSRGADVRVDVVLTLEEAASGIEKSIRLDRSRLCETCDGSGAKAGSKPETCRQCGGSGHCGRTSTSGTIRRGGHVLQLSLALRGT